MTALDTARRPRRSLPASLRAPKRARLPYLLLVDREAPFASA